MIYGRTGRRRRQQIIMARRRRPIPKRKITIGMRVTCREQATAYYSGRGGVPAMLFTPGMVGTVGAVDVACVTYVYRDVGGTATFVCVDFEVAGKTWRCALYYNNIKIVAEA